MAAWRKKAYNLFGFKPGSYSNSRGKVDLFADLAAMADQAVATCDNNLMGRIIEYVSWATEQKSEQMGSAIDLAFFLPAFRNPALRPEIQRRIPADLFSRKWRALMEEPAEPDPAADGGGIS